MLLATEEAFVVDNLSNKLQLIPVGASLGTCKVVDRMKDAEVKPGGLPVVGKGVPPHLQESFQSSTVCLSVKEHTLQVGQLLTCYADVLSKRDHDLRKTNFIQHHIHTVDSWPIRQPPRKIAPAQRMELEEAVQEVEGARCD